jgi:hypothetical protein
LGSTNPQALALAKRNASVVGVFPSPLALKPVKLFVAIEIAYNQRKRDIQINS